MQQAPSGKDFDRLDDALSALRLVLKRPTYRRRVAPNLGGTTFATLRTTRAVDRLAGAPAGIADVADVLSIDRSTASRAVDDAVEQGYLSRTAAESDRRRSVLAVTERGRDLLERMTMARREVLADAMNDWTTTEIHDLTDRLERLLAGFERLERAE